MRTGRTRTAVVVGVQAHPVEVEAHVAQGLPHWTIVGLPDTAVSESRDRVRAAVASSGLPWPTGRITVGLSPASLPKRGSGLDLGIGMAVLAAASNGTDLPSAERLSRWMFVGELGLDGSVRPVGSVLPAALAARAGGADCFVVPAASAREAALVSDLVVLPVHSLQHLWALLRGEAEPASDPGDDRWEPERSLSGSPSQAAELDLADVRGQEPAKRALAIAAAGGHHLCLVGPAGVGKTMLASRLPSLLPDLDDDDALAATAIAAQLEPHRPPQLVRRPPFCAPHHTSTDVVLAIDGGASRPGCTSGVPLWPGCWCCDGPPLYAHRRARYRRLPATGANPTESHLGRLEGSHEPIART